jgi:hypothetical protein
MWTELLGEPSDLDSRMFCNSNSGWIFVKWIIFRSFSSSLKRARNSRAWCCLMRTNDNPGHSTNAIVQSVRGS